MKGEGKSWAVGFGNKRAGIYVREREISDRHKLYFWKLKEFL